MTLQEIMNGWEKIVVFAGDEVIITWNKSLMLQAWGHVRGQEYKALSFRILEEVPDLTDACLRAESFYWRR